MSDANVFNSLVNKVIVVSDRHSKLLYASPNVQKVFGRTVDDVVGKFITTLMPQEFRTLHMSAMDNYLLTGNKTANWNRTERQALKADGTIFPITVQIIDYEHQNEKYFIGIIEDLTHPIKHSLPEDNYLVMCKKIIETLSQIT